jgi:hypothetical protein
MLARQPCFLAGIFSLATMVHYGEAESIFRQRQAVPDVAYQLYPERFTHSAPTPPELPLTMVSQECQPALSQVRVPGHLAKPS